MGDRIREAVVNCLKGFDLLNKVMFIVTDNASNMKKAFTVQLVADEEQDAPGVDDPELWEDLEEGEDVDQITVERARLSCFAHSLQLCVGDGLKVSLFCYLYYFVFSTVI